MPQEKTWERIALLLLVAIQLWVFSGSFSKYFNLDSAWYVIHSPRSWSELGGLFTAPDSGKQFRPVTLAFMALFVPLFKLDPHPYHWIPIVFHIANTCLLFPLARRLLNGPVAVIAATAFWGIHSVAGWITYDTTCTPDYMQAFFLLVCLVLAVDGVSKTSRARIAGSIVAFMLALLTKESSTTIPLALLICLVLARIRVAERAPGIPGLSEAFRKALPLTAVFLFIAAVHAGILFHWLLSGRLYTQGAGAAYNLGLWSNALAKSKYLYWALNLPDALVIPHANWIRPVIFGLTGLFICCLIWVVLRNRKELEVAAWAGVAWFVGMSIPALMLSNRVAKWYLYVPLLGLSLAVGALVQSIPGRLHGWKARVATPAALALCILPNLLSSAAQTRSYLRSSDAAFASNVLQSFYRDLRQSFPQQAPRATVLLLPSFEPEISRILSYVPDDTGKLLELYLPGTEIKILFAHMGERLTSEQLCDPHTRVFQELNGTYHDVTRYYRSSGSLTLFVLPTAEGTAPPLLKKEPIGGWNLHGNHVRVMLGDEGAALPENSPQREDLWILQYINGHISDVTDYFRGRKRSPARRLVPNLEGLRTTVNRGEFYPDYTRFSTPTGLPVFFPTPQKEILTQIGGSTMVVPIERIGPNAMLCFDTSWMFDAGDGAWAEMLLRSEGRETVIYQRYMNPNPAGTGPTWQEVQISLAQFAGQKAELLLSCRNKKGNNTVADWLNWRDITIE